MIHGIMTAVQVVVGKPRASGDDPPNDAGALGAIG